MRRFTFHELGGVDVFDFRAPRAVQPFPRHKSLLYAALCLVWLFFGVFGRDPWKPDETVLTAIIADMATSGFLLPPLLLGEAYLDYPPLYLWLAALTAKLSIFGLPPHEGARLANVVLLLAGFFLLWKVVYRADGARIAWLAVLLCIGAVGFMIRAHLLNFGVPAFFGSAVVLWGASVLRARYYVDIKGGFIVVAGGLFLLFAVGWLTACVAIFAVGLWWGRMLRQPLNAAFVVLLFVPVSWWLLDRTGYAPLAGVANKWSVLSLSGFGNALLDWVRVIAWSLLPLSFLAAWGLYKEWRALSPLSAFAVLSCICFLLLFFLTGENEEDLYAVLPPLALLAARALQQAPDNMARVLDSFALLIIGVLCCGSIWVMWFALHTGQPEFIAQWLVEALPRFFAPAIAWWKVVFAAFLTIGWGVLLANFGRSNERAAVNWACGITLLWSVFNLLLLEYVDTGKSYRPSAVAIAAKIGDSCLSEVPNNHWRAQLHYFGVQIRDNGCPYALSERPAAVTVWKGGRGGKQTYHLIRRF